MPAAKKPATKKPVRKAAKKPVAKKPVAKKPVARKSAAKKPVAKQRADLGAPIDGYLARQAPAQRAILEALRRLVREVAQDASESIKWGMPFYMVTGANLCVLAAHKAHVAITFFAPPEVFEDPEHLLEGTGKTGRHLKIRTPADLRTDQIRGWILHAAHHARS
jgi:hypothetical protein